MCNHLRFYAIRNSINLLFMCLLWVSLFLFFFYYDDKKSFAINQINQLTFIDLNWIMESNSLFFPFLCMMINHNISATKFFCSRREQINHMHENEKYIYTNYVVGMFFSSLFFCNKLKKLENLVLRLKLTI